MRRPKLLQNIENWLKEATIPLTRTGESLTILVGPAANHFFTCDSGQRIVLETEPGASDSWFQICVKIDGLCIIEPDMQAVYALNACLFVSSLEEFKELLNFATNWDRNIARPPATELLPLRHWFARVCVPVRYFQTIRLLDLADSLHREVLASVDIPLCCFAKNPLRSWEESSRSIPADLLKKLPELPADLSGIYFELFGEVFSTNTSRLRYQEPLGLPLLLVRNPARLSMVHMRPKSSPKG
jgi:hypothetical protein